MARRTITLDEKIEKAQAEVDKKKAAYDEAVEKLKELEERKREIDNEELLKLIETSSKNIEEIKAFLSEE